MVAGSAGPGCGRAMRRARRVRHRVSKMLLRHGRVNPSPSTWTQAHRRWLSRQQFDETSSELVFADQLAAVDGLSARKAAVAERLSHLASEEHWWPTVARLRCFRGVDTLSAFALHLELGGDWKRFQKATALSAWLGLTPSLIGATLQNRQQGKPAHILRSPTAPNNDYTASITACAPAASRTTSQSLPAHASLPVSSGRQRPPTDRDRQPHRSRGRGAGPSAAGARATTMSSSRPRPSRSLLDSASRQHETGPWGTQHPHHQTGNADTAPDAPPSQPKKNPAKARQFTLPLDKPHDISAVGHDPAHPGLAAQGCRRRTPRPCGASVIHKS
jgi:hypothetical protein